MGVFSFLFVDGPSGSTLVPRWQARDVKMVTPDRRILVSNLQCFLFRNAGFFRTQAVVFSFTFRSFRVYRMSVAFFQRRRMVQAWDRQPIKGSGLGSTTRSDS